MCLKVWGLRHAEQLSDSFSVRWEELDPPGINGVYEHGNEKPMTLKSLCNLQLVHSGQSQLSAAAVGCIAWGEIGVKLG